MPPDELNLLLSLYKTVSHKTLRISKTFGIEGRKLLTPEDQYDALRDFIHAYEGTTTPVEKMHLEFQLSLLADFPGLEHEAGLRFPAACSVAKKIRTRVCEVCSFCYALPAPPGPGGRVKGEDGKRMRSLVERGYTRLVPCGL